MKRLLLAFASASLFMVVAALPVTAEPPPEECTAPPVIHQINPRSVAEPQVGDFNTGTFHVHGSNFQQGQVFTDGPLALVGDTWVDPAGRLAKRDFSIGAPAPVPGETFHIFVVTPCGVDSITVLITD
jgi:hypothetical protein